MPPRDYYEVLGVSPDAAPEEIKKSYRQLVRKFHPDVHHDKKLAERAFLQINEAYRILSDPVERRSYDLQRLARKRESASRAQAPTGSTGRGRPQAQAKGPSAGRAGRPGAADTSAAKLIRDAEYAFIRGRLVEAESLARRAVQMDRASARAYTILGDVYQARNIRDKALQNYSYAVQYDPHNSDLLTKVDRIVGAGAAARMRSGSPGPAVRPGPGTLAAHLLGWCAFFMVFFYVVTVPVGGISAEASADLMGLLDSPSMMLALCADGLLLGMLLRTGAVLGHHDDEMVFQTMHRGVRRPLAVPVGVMLVTLAMALFWAALAAYFVLASVQENMSRSLTRSFTVTLFYVTAAALLLWAQGGQAMGMLALGGNFVFVSLLAGWWSVDAWRQAGESRP